MPLLTWTALTMLTIVGLTVMAPAFGGAAMAAAARPNPAHSRRVRSPTRRRADPLCARPLRFPPEEMIPAVLNLPWFPGPDTTLNIGGVRLPLGDCGPTDIDPATGAIFDNRPTQDGDAYIARMKARAKSRRPSR